MTFNQHQPWWEEFERSMAFRALQKPVLASQPILFNRSLDDWRVEGIARVAIVGDNPFDGQPCFRFQTSMRDEAALRRERNVLGSFSGESGGGTSAILAFEPPQDWSDYNRIAAWIYPHPAAMRRVALNLQLEPNFRDPIPPYDFISFPRPTFHAQHLVPGQWNQVLWEIGDYPRQAITGFVLSQELFGHEPGTPGIVIYDLGRLELQRVEGEKYEGWEVAPGRIAYSHLGYLPGQRKVALASGSGPSVFQALDYSGETVLTRAATPLVTPQGRFLELDFSDLPEGYYRLRLGSAVTQAFPVGEDLWRLTIRKLLNFYTCERCNWPVPGLHDACHLDLFGVHGEVRKPINGGWHDAADFSQGCHQTGLSIYAMLAFTRQLHLTKQDPQLEKRILEEARWGLDWLLKTRFGDGFRIAFQVARIYTDNIPGTIDDILIPARNVPFLNLLCAAVEALAFECLLEVDPALAQESLRCAEEDWRFGTAAGDQDYLAAAWGAVASTDLYRATHETSYAEKALAYGKYLLACQERSFKDGISLAGYFYRDPARAEIVHHNHLGFEESPLLALTCLCQAFPDHPDWIAWYAAAAIHADFLQKRAAAYTAPFYMLANGVYRQSEYEDRNPGEAEGIFAVDSLRHERGAPAQRQRREKLRQVQDGVPLGGDYYLRRFPVWENDLFHGGTGVQLSQTLALALASHLRSDLPGEKLALRQLQWVIGLNPFSQSLMYGEGNDYVSLHAHRQMDMVGALPVGMDCRAGDQPYWSPSNFATQKEIWVVPASRFLWSLAYLGLPARVSGRVNGAKTKSISFQHQMTRKFRRARLEAGGAFACNLPGGEYQVRCGKLRLALRVASGSSLYLQLDVEAYIDFDVMWVRQKKPAADLTAARYTGGNTRQLDLITEAKTERLRVTASGLGRHTFEIRTFNARPALARFEVSLEEGLPEVAYIDLAVEDPSTPWLALVIPDGQPDRAKEVLVDGVSTANRSGVQ